MQCSRCSYIQFKTSSKCGNCGYDFKKLKSSVLTEAEKPFTIFASAGAVYSHSSAGGEEDFHQDSSVADRERTDTEMDDDGYYDSADLVRQNELAIDSFGDFALDLSDADGPDSESWDIGATLAGDLSESTDTDQDEFFMKDNDLETGDFEVQGLGFDIEADQSETKDSDDDEEEDEFFLPEEPEENSADDADEITLETALTIDDDEPDEKPTSESSIELETPEIELSPTIELEGLQMDLENDSLEIETPEEDQTIELEAPDLKLKIEFNEDETNPPLSDEEPTPDR